MSNKEYKISKESVDRVFRQSPITHIPFDHRQIIERHDYGGYIHKSLMAEVIDTTDKVMFDAVIRYADEHFATDLFIIDEEFIKSAIENEIQRRMELIK